MSRNQLQCLSLWYFLDKSFKFQPYVCKGCHDALIISINLNNISILNAFLVLIMVVLLIELTKVKPKMYCKKLI